VSTAGKEAVLVSTWPGSERRYMTLNEYLDELYDVADLDRAVMAHESVTE
jgi:hypothetical protein